MGLKVNLVKNYRGLYGDKDGMDPFEFHAGVHMLIAGDIGRTMTPRLVEYPGKDNDDGTPAQLYPDLQPPDDDQSKEVIKLAPRDQATAELGELALQAA